MKPLLHGRVVLAISFVTTLPLANHLHAAEHLIGHRVTVNRYGGNPILGKAVRFVAKAGQDGNPAAFPLPSNPIANGGSVLVARGGGVLYDSLTAGTWTGLGSPPGSAGWKYLNHGAPAGGEVRLLLITPGAIKLVAKGTGSMPIPAAPNAAIEVVVVADTEKYCARAEPPHIKEIDGKLVRATEQGAPLSCPACMPNVDTDGDRLEDCYETNTMVFNGPTDTGTDPLDPDTDGDAIKDGDEVLGTAMGLNLPAMGTNPLRKDILVEYDWFDDALECAAHSHRPTEAMLNAVTAAFAAAPVMNPDGTTGINFIHDRGQGGEFSGGNLINDSNGVLSGGVNHNEFQVHKAQNFAANRHGYFHYTILPHRYDTNSNSSGQAELPGDDMIVSLYCAGSTSNVANTIVHELGHNLGLHHGGNTACNYKPNYNSVMNYRYQFAGVDNNCTPPGNGVLDYSKGDRIPLDENNLDENMGTCGSTPWDWNGNSVIENGVSVDVNSADTLQAFNCGGVLTVLEDHDDWSNLNFGGISDFDGAALLPPEIIDCDNPPPMEPPK